MLIDWFTFELTYVSTKYLDVVPRISAVLPDIATLLVSSAASDEPMVAEDNSRSDTVFRV